MVRALTLYTPLTLTLPRMVTVAAHSSPFIPSAAAWCWATILQFTLVVRATTRLTVSHCAAFAPHRHRWRGAFLSTNVCAGTRPIAESWESIIVTTL